VSANGEIELRCGRSRARISPFGAELKSWRVGGRELLWRADPAIWAQTCPVLFPVVGWCRAGQIRIDGTSYPMPVHGFASACMFELETCADDQAVFLLRDNTQTRAHYPAAFLLRVAFALRDEDLEVRIRVSNEDARDLYFACGLHPGFAVPFAGGAPGDYFVEFEKPEINLVPVIAEGGLFSRERRAVPLDGRCLRLGPALFENEALCFLNCNSSAISMSRPGHGAIAMQVENLPHFAVWSRPGAPFVSLEAWSGYGDPEDFCGDISLKPGMRLLEPGNAAEFSAAFSYSDR